MGQEHCQAVSKLLEGAGILQYFDDIVSVEEVRRFKPDPAVYAYLRNRVEAAANDIAADLATLGDRVVCAVLEARGVR